MLERKSRMNSPKEQGHKNNQHFHVYQIICSWDSLAPAMSSDSHPSPAELQGPGAGHTGGLGLHVQVSQRPQRRTCRWGNYLGDGRGPKGVRLGVGLGVFVAFSPGIFLDMKIARVNLLWGCCS